MDISSKSKALYVGFVFFFFVLGDDLSDVTLLLKYLSSTENSID